MTLPPEISQLFIFRRPVSEDGGYAIFSDDKRYQAEASVPPVTGIEWTLTFKTATSSIITPMRVDRLKFDLLDEDAKVVGRVKEAPFSVAGKMVVEDENRKTLGFLTPKRWVKTAFLAADGQELAVAEHYRDRKSKLPLLLKEHQIHMARRYVVERTLPLAFDERMVIGFVCLLVAEEHRTSAG